MGWGDGAGGAANATGAALSVAEARAACCRCCFDLFSSSRISSGFLLLPPKVCYNGITPAKYNAWIHYNSGCKISNTLPDGLSVRLPAAGVS